MRAPINAPNKRADGTDILETWSKHPAPIRSTRNTFGCNLVTLGEHVIADKIRDPAPSGAAHTKRVGSSRRPDVDEVTT